MSNTPFFSIIVPTYNQSQYLKEALDSIISQTDGDWEAVIVNDGSTDGTADILETYAQKESRFRIIHQKNGGTGSALNTALKKATGQWICWLSSDDVFEINKLEIHRKWIEKYPDYKFFFSQCRQLVGTSGKIVNSNSASNKSIPPIELQIIEMLKKNYVAGNSICICRESWLKTSLFNEELRYGQDYDMWLRLMIEYRALFIPKFTYLQRIYPGQESHRFSNYCLYDCAKSSIEVLNKHNLKEFLPLVNLHDSGSLEKAVNAIFNIAFDPSIHIYQMGFHPLLILKTQVFLDKYAPDSNLNTIFIKRLEKNSTFYKNTLIGFWCDFSQYVVTDNSFAIDESISVSFQQLGEIYYLWVSYLESILHEQSLQKSLLNYLQRFYITSTLEKLNNPNLYQSIFSGLLDFQSLENKQEYINFFQSKQIFFSDYSFSHKLFYLNTLEVSPSYITTSLFKNNGLLKGFLATFLIYFLRILHLYREGNLLRRLKYQIINLF